jgi:hypothetical protein
MNKKYQYGKNTAHYKMPSYGKGDIISPELEFDKLQSIENQLLAGTKGIKCCVFEDGNYILRKESETKYKVLLTGTGRKKAACGIVNGIYFEESSKLSWGDLKVGYVNYLYISGTIRLFEKKGAYRPFSSTFKRDLPKTACLMATVDLREGREEVDTKPSGKVSSMDVVRHTYSKENPHGENLIQKEITISEKLNFKISKNKPSNESIITISDERDLKVPVIDTNAEIILKDKRSKTQLSEDGHNSLNTDNKSIIGAINELASLSKADSSDKDGDEFDGGNAGINFFKQDSSGLEAYKTKIINFNTSKKGVKLSVEKNEEVMFVQVQQRFIDKIKNTGIIAIGYHEDGAVKNKNEFVVHIESGEEVSMKAVIYYR